MKLCLRVLGCMFLISSSTQGLALEPTVFSEQNGIVAVEAEHFFRQSKMEQRSWHLTTSSRTPEVKPDGDPSHVGGASNGAYLELLPDTRRTHADKLTRGVNFSPEAGKMAVLEYRVHFSTPGRYYVWVRAHSTGSEDNGLHVGLDGQWPSSGQRLQWCAGKQQWFWESKQRTEKQHCGEPYKIYLDIDAPGVHTIAFSMREDGFEFDKWIMTRDREFSRPSGVGPAPVVHSGDKPQSFPLVAAPARPAKQVEETATPAQLGKGSLLMLADAFPLEGSGYYLDNDKWMAINPDNRKEAASKATFPFPTGKYDVTLRAVGENDGRSTYEVSVDDKQIGNFTCPLSKETFEEGPKYHVTFKGIEITSGAIIGVRSAIASKDGDEFSRARWSGIAFRPADAATRKAAASELAKQEPTPAGQSKIVSPTKNVSDQPLQQPRKPDGGGEVTVHGELKQWHKVTVDIDGPFAHEQDNAPNPFTDLHFQVEFEHESGARHLVQGYFAADGDAANSSADSGTVWRAHLAPELTGKWTYTVHFRKGDQCALYPDRAAVELKPFDGKSGSFEIGSSDKTGVDLRAHGRVAYVGKRYLQHLGSKAYFLKAGADAPETLLGYVDFDGTVAGKPAKVPLKTFAPHLGDWKQGDPSWADGKGKGLIGAINYLSSKGCNAFSFLTYNAGGDGDNVWPFIDRDDKMHYDCSKLAQWAIVFEHGTSKGMYLHFKMQENESDDHRRGTSDKIVGVPESLDGGDLGPQRRLYVRELAARFGHNLALNWNLGEENTQTTAQLKDMLNFIDQMDPYNHNRVLHTFPGQQDKQYRPLLGDASVLTGLSVQNSALKDTHPQTVKWVEESTQAGKPWVVAFDESGSAAHAQCPDLGYKGFEGKDTAGQKTHTEHAVRKQTLWGTLMGGGGGVEYYFGYKYVENDLICEDWRSRDRSWDYCRFALEFFRQHVQFAETVPADELVGNANHGNDRYCLANAGKQYVVYQAEAGPIELDLQAATGQFEVRWYNPRVGGDLQIGSVSAVAGGKKVNLGNPPQGSDAVTTDMLGEKHSDWVILVQKP